MEKYFIVTMGCKLNENDSEKIAGIAEELNYVKADTIEEADLILLNTCCVRELPEEKLFGKLGEAKKVKEKRDAIVAVGGCMMQEAHMIEKVKKSYPFVDIIFGTNTLHKLREHLITVGAHSICVRTEMDSAPTIRFVM